MAKNKTIKRSKTQVSKSDKPWNGEAESQLQQHPTKQISTKNSDWNQGESVSTEKPQECRSEGCCRLAIHLLKPFISSENESPICKECKEFDEGTNEERKIPSQKTSSSDKRVLLKDEEADAETKTSDKQDRSRDDNDQLEEEEMWDLVEVLSVTKIVGARPVMCQGENCRLKAAVVYSSSESEKWYSCLDCQEHDFGGWPDAEEMSKFAVSREQEIVFRQHCSKNPMIHIPAITSLDRDSSMIDDAWDAQEETWELTKILSVAEITGQFPVICQTDNCRLKAAVAYVSSAAPGNKWYSCIDCQKADFGGWPGAEEMRKHTITTDQLEVFRKHCSRTPIVVVPEASVTKGVFTSPLLLKNGHSSSETRLVSPIVAESDPNLTPIKATSKVALDMHKKWQQDAKYLGGPDARIVVEKTKAKKLIFDVLNDELAPMNIAELHRVLKAVVPSPILKTCLDDMSSDSCKDNAFFEDQKSVSTKTAPKVMLSHDPYTASLLFKPGRNAQNSLYYVDLFKSTDQGNGLDGKAKSDLCMTLAKSDHIIQTLQDKINLTRRESTALIIQPVNETVMLLLDAARSKLIANQMKTEDSRKLKANMLHKKRIKRRVTHMASEWRKRRRLCLDFLAMAEEMTEGVVQRSSCLLGDGPFEIRSDSCVANIALTKFTKKKETQTKQLVTSSLSLSNDCFVAVRLNTQGTVERVYA